LQIDGFKSPPGIWRKGDPSTKDVLTKKDALALIDVLMPNGTCEKILSGKRRRLRQIRINSKSKCVLATFLHCPEVFASG